MNNKTRNPRSTENNTNKSKTHDLKLEIQDLQEQDPRLKTPESISPKNPYTYYEAQENN